MPLLARTEGGSAKLSVPAHVALDKLRQTLESGLAGLTVELERIK